MDYSLLFKQAHKLAKSIIKAGDDYRITFGACLKMVKQLAKQSANKVTFKAIVLFTNGKQETLEGYSNARSFDVYAIESAIKADNSKIKRVLIKSVSHCSWANKTDDKLYRLS